MIARREMKEMLGLKEMKGMLDEEGVGSLLIDQVGDGSWMKQVLLVMKQLG